MTPPSPRSSAILLAALVVVAAAGGYAWQDARDTRAVRLRAEAITGGDAARGERRFAAYGCGGCHAIEGVPRATGLVGPPLDTIGQRAVIGGHLANTPSNLEDWIADPQAVSPGTAMPRLGVTPADARDIAAFLYTRNDG